MTNDKNTFPSDKNYFYVRPARLAILLGLAIFLWGMNFGLWLAH